MYLNAQCLLPTGDENRCADTVDLPVEPDQLDQLVALVDHCTAAKDIAESLNDTFLAYMVSMTIQAARREMRAKALPARR